MKGFQKGHTLWRGKTGQGGRYKHGHASNRKPSPEYLAYDSAKQRCTNPKDQGWEYYGGRGIKFLFDSFEQFLAEIGPRPSSKHSLDRKENDGHYAPGNVRWATKKEQMQNRRYKALSSFTTEELTAELERRHA